MSHFSRPVSGSGTGDMNKVVYDTDGDSVVDSSEKLEGLTLAQVRNHTPAAHSSSHTNGVDDIQSATAGQKGLATTAQITKLDGIETGADVTANHAPKAHKTSHTDGTDDIQSATALQKGLATTTQITKLDGIETGADVTGSHAPQAHAASHTNGGDDIQSATAAQKGLATATQITKLDGIEAGADVTATHIPTNTKRAVIMFVFGNKGSGVALTANMKVYLSEVGFAGTIIRATITGGASGAAVVDIWKKNILIPTVTETITASAKPTLAAAQYTRDTTLSGWTTAIADGDVFCANLDSVDGVLDHVSVALTVERT